MSEQAARSENRTAGPGTEAFTRLMRGVEHEFAWHTGRVLTGLTFKRMEGGWLLVIKARQRLPGGEWSQPVVAFVEAHTPEECLFFAAWKWETRPGMTWLPDRYINAK